MNEDEGLDEAIRTLLLAMPRLVARTKRMSVPEQLRGFSLAPRHLSLLAYLQFDGELGVKELAERLEVAPTTVSLMVADLDRQGVVQRRADDNDRRRTIVSIPEEHHEMIEAWLGQSAIAWRKALGPLTPRERQLVLDTLDAYERALDDA